MYTNVKIISMSNAVHKEETKEETREERLESRKRKIIEKWDYERENIIKNNPDDPPPKRITMVSFDVWKTFGIYVSKIDEIVNKPTIDGLYPEHLLTRPFDFILLPDMPLLSYKIADKIRIELNLDVSDENRAKAWTMYAFKEQAYIRHGKLFGYYNRRTETNVNGMIQDEFGDNEIMKGLVENYLERTKVKAYNGMKSDRNPRGWLEYFYTSTTIREVETHLETMVTSLRSRPNNYPSTMESIFNSGTLEEKQVEHIHKVYGINNNGIGPKISCLTGGPGTGKTTTVKEIIRMYKVWKPESKILCTALSGMAVNALKSNFEESEMFSELLRKITLGTIHKTIIFNKKLDPYDLVIIDESTMINMFILRSIMRRLINENENCTFIFIGDVNQLPPIGVGQVFRDFINHGNIVTTILEINQRQSGELRNTISKILQRGEVLTLHDNFKLWNYNSGTYFSFIKKKLEKYRRENNIESDEMWSSVLKRDFQFLSPQEGRDGGVQDVNRFVQALMKSYGVIGQRILSHEYNDFHVGDKIINKKNDYTADPAIYNGQIGEIVSFDRYKRTITVLFYNGVTYTYESYKDFKYKAKLAYCVTVHSAQGSGFKNVCVIMSESSKMWPSNGRPLLYTAASRARENLWILTTQELLTKARRSENVIFTAFLQHDKY